MIRLSIHNTTLTAPANLAFQTRHADLTIDTIEDYGKRAIKSVEILSVRKDAEIIKMLSLCYVFVRDLQDVIGRIHVVVKNNYNNGHTQPELSKVAAALSNVTNSIEQSFADDDASVLKNLLVKGLQELAPQTRKVHKVIESSSDGYFRNDVILVMDDILFAAQRVYFYNEYEKKSRQELVDVINECKTRLLTGAHAITKEHPENIRDFMVATHYAIRKMFDVNKSIDEEAITFEGELKYRLFQISYNLKYDLEEVDNGMRRKDEFGTIQEYLKMCTRTCHNEMMALASLLDVDNPDRKISVKLNNLIRFATATHRAAVEQYLETMKIISERL